MPVKAIVLMMEVATTQVAKMQLHLTIMMMVMTVQVVRMATIVAVLMRLAGMVLLQLTV
jgi:hypothetical protein